MNKTIVLNCQGVYKSFKEGGLDVEVLRGINFQVATQEQIAIIGSSGSGKSTLLHLLGGLDNPSAGEISVAGKLMNRLSHAQRGLWRNRTWALSINFTIYYLNLLR
jgi:lipoprotein-releasing system ATP-binding protein